MHPVCVILVRAAITHHSCVENILLLLRGNIVEADDLKGTCYFNYLLIGAHGYFTNSF